MNAEEYQRRLRESKNNQEKIKNVFNEISADLINNGYSLSADISAARMLTFCKFMPYKYIEKLYPQQISVPIIDGLRFVMDTIGKSGNIQEEAINSFADTRKNLLDMLNGIYCAGSDLNSLLDLYDQENVIRYSAELKPLYPSAHDFIENTVDYLYGQIYQAPESTEINKTIKKLVMLLPVGFVKNEFLSYVEDTLRDAVIDMPYATIKEVYDRLRKLIRHTSNPYYMEMFNIAVKYGFDKKPGNLSGNQLDKNIAKIGSFMKRLDLAEEITTSVLLMYDLITDNETNNHIDMNKYLYIKDIINSYLAGERIKADIDDIIKTDMVDKQIDTVSLLSDKAGIFTKAGIEQSVLTATTFKGIMFAKYDSLYDELYSGLFSLFEYGNYDESDESADDVSVEEFIEDIVDMTEDELSHFPAFFRKERMRSIMNALPVGFNDIEEIHEYIHKSIDSIADDRLLYYIEAIVSAMPDVENDQQ